SRITRKPRVAPWGEPESRPPSFRCQLDGGSGTMKCTLRRAAFLVVVVSGFAGASQAGATTGGGGMWTSTGPLTLARGFHTADRQAIRLANGSLLVEGGDTTNGKISSAVTNAELFDPLTKTWTATAPLG